MASISNNKNLEAHYSTNSKVQRPKITIANAPNNLPNSRMPYYDKDANKRMQAINDDIYKDYKSEKQRKFTGAFKFISATALAILTVLGIKKLFFKKS